MKQVIKGKTYNTETMSVIVEKNVYHNGNYCGSNTIRITRNGNYCYVRTSNGQDLYRNSGIEALGAGEIAGRIDGWTLSDEEQAELLKRGIITEA